MIAEVVRLEERVETLEEREESTRRKFEAHLTDEADSRRSTAEALQAIRFDVHEIRAGEKSRVRMAKLFLLVATLTGAGVVMAARWTLEHALADWQQQHDPSGWRRIP
jgi:hypothetical protein